MKYKPDWLKARRNLSALWRGETLKRPCIAVTAPLECTAATEVPEPADDEARWLDPDYRIALVRRTLESTWWGGEAIPSGLLVMPNWVICLGGTPRFSPDTIWFETQRVDFNRPSPFRHDPRSPWVRRYTALLSALCEEAGRGDFLVGQPGGLPANDLLAMLMGTGEFLLALKDHPDWMAEAIFTGAKDQQAARKRFQEMIRSRNDFWYGNSGWMTLWAPEPFVVMQSDVSCMLPPPMFEHFVVPELELAGREHNALWYHLDGADAMQHLPGLLSLPYLRVLQYTPAPNESPNGPAHIELYRKVQSAGKILHIGLPKEDVEDVVRALDPGLLMLETECSSREEGESLLRAAEKWVAAGGA